MTPLEKLRAGWNLLNGSTLAGLGLAAAARCSLARGPRGLILAHGYRPRLPKAFAFTVGNVVLLRWATGGPADNPQLLGHESRHSTQYALCLGLPFLPLYAVAALWSLWRTGDPASRNVFERHAGLRSGGYVERTVRRGPGRRRNPANPPV
ncbi:MAG TPA: hypothetical protein VN601_10625 [Arthrobacter sp.]|nr:hypothetical protein [Arthrobacter sp.]